MPAVLKTRTGGYEGHGLAVLRANEDLQALQARMKGRDFPPSVLEGFVDFVFESSILVSGDGKNYVTFPMVRNEHHHKYPAHDSDTSPGRA